MILISNIIIIRHIVQYIVVILIENLSAKNAQDHVIIGNPFRLPPCPARVDERRLKITSLPNHVNDSLVPKEKTRSFR